MKLKLCLWAVMAIVGFSSCKKNEERLLLKEEKRLEGVWNLDEYTIETTDSIGVILSNVKAENVGYIEFKLSTDEGADVFNPVLFEEGADDIELVNYFKGQSAGDATVKGGWSLYWDADPDGKRILFWGITGGGSLHTTVNIENAGKNNQTLFYTRSLGNGQRVFYTFKMSK